MTVKFEDYSKLCAEWEKFDGILNVMYIRAMKLYGCSFQAPICLTWSRNDGNATVTHFPL